MPIMGEYMSPPRAEETNGLDASGQGTWREWARHVLLELERLDSNGETASKHIAENRDMFDDKITQVRQDIQTVSDLNRDRVYHDINELKVELAMLKVRAGLWGAVGAAIPILITIAISLFVNYLTKHGG